eukprot:TRINITY_DN1278_c0_g1_i3.p1 TRINITY_DN1278_c0_g1~~TRINITY_DN1278_c0_g1_i3.p1  ORF type:complete len:126 (+),score=7.66 TRINITY_DN1278_c0_g1_i3:95-472(+)
MTTAKSTLNLLECTRSSSSCTCDRFEWGYCEYCDHPGSSHEPECRVTTQDYGDCTCTEYYHPCLFCNHSLAEHSAERCRGLSCLCKTFVQICEKCGHSSDCHVRGKCSLFVTLLFTIQDVPSPIA